MTVRPMSGCFSHLIPIPARTRPFNGRQGRICLEESVEFKKSHPSPAYIKEEKNKEAWKFMLSGRIEPPFLRDLLL